MYTKVSSFGTIITFLTLFLTNGCATHDSGAVHPAPLAVAATAPVAGQTPAQFDIESHFFVLDEKDMAKLPNLVRSRLSAFSAKNYSRCDQTLSPDEVNSLLEAVSPLSSPLPSVPVLKVSEGALTNLRVETQQAYVSSLTEIRAPGAMLFDPQVSTMPYSSVGFTCSVSRENDGSGTVVSWRSRVGRLVTLIPVTQMAEVKSLEVPPKIQIVSGTYQMPVSSMYDSWPVNCTVPAGQTLLLACFKQTIGKVDTSTTQPTIDKLSEERLAQENGKHVFLLVKPRLVSAGNIRRPVYNVITSGV